MKKRKRMFLSFCLLLVPVLLGGCITLTPEPGTEGKSGADAVHYYEDETYSYRTAVDETALTTGLSARYLLLANKQYPLGENYTPADLVTLTCPTAGGKKVELDRGAAAALDAMMAEMAADGVKDITVTSGFRTYAYQKQLYEMYLGEELNGISQEAYACLGKSYIQTRYLDKGKTALDHSDAEKVVLSYSAYPGTSEHQTGLCVDFLTSTMNNSLTVAFEETPAFRWLSANAYRFGFILRYPKTAESITGYTYEPWHYRFVGREAATDIYYGNLTLEEYFGAN